MTEPVISVERLSKRFVIRHERATHHETLRDTLAAAVRQPFKWLAGEHGENERSESHEEFWALREVSFSVEPGERVGIIGRNGAGKSTLLKILSRITRPTTGVVRVRGRIASLLEVGTGFHPELSGRENIFLNGSILGMARTEIRKHFDEIVEFSGVEQFLDTPVKRYSSGMYVRLAFAVAAFLDPDVLIVDEVLAVGDASFQKKCLSRMRDLERSAKTVLFVSHNLSAVSALCSKIIVLHEGRVLYRLGDVDGGLEAYNALEENTRNVPLGERSDREGRGRAQFTFARCYSEENAAEVATGRPFTLEFTIRKGVAEVIEDVAVFVSVLGSDGGLVTVLTSEVASPFRFVQEIETVQCHMKRLPLSEGEYRINVMIRSGGVIEDWVQDAAAISVQHGQFFDREVSVPKSHRGAYVEQDWRSNREDW